MFLSTRILDSSYILIASLTAMVAGALLLFSVEAAAMTPLAEDEMDAITAAGNFSRVVVEDDTAKVWLNIHVETHAYIESFKANYHSGAWDQEWYDVYLGTYTDRGTVDEARDEANPLRLQGFILEAQFDNPIGDPNQRLLSMKVGFDVVNGEIRGEFDSFSGFHDDPRLAFYRADFGPGTFTFTDDRIHMIFDARGYAQGLVDPGLQPGIYFDFGEASFVADP